MFDSSFQFSEVDGLFQVLPFIKLFFPPAKADFHFNQAFFEIEAKRDNGAPATLDGLLPFVDLPFGEEQFAGAVGVVVGTGAEAVLSDVRMVQDRNSPVDSNEAVIDLDGAGPDRFDFGSGEDEARLKGFVDKIIPLSGRVAHFAVAVFRLRFTAHNAGWRKSEKKRRP